MTTPENKKVTVSTRDAAALMHILLERGYFTHRNGSSDADTLLDTAILIERTNQSYITVEKLQEELQAGLNDRGRWSVQEAAVSLFVSESTLRNRIIPVLGGVTCVRFANGDISEVLTTDYLGEKSKDLLKTLDMKGRISLADVAESIYDLPVEDALKIAEDLVAGNSSIHIRLDDHGAKVLVTDGFLDELKDRILKAFRACSEPVDVKKVVKDNGWEQTWVHRIVEKELDLPGEFHGETYVPNCFTENKRQAVIDAFHSDGYVTSHMCQNLFGMSTAQMKDCISKEETTLVLENSVIHPDVIVGPIAAAVQEAIDGSTWLDLQLHLPLELLEHQTDDARTIVEEHVLQSNDNDICGISCIRSDGALFFSQAMVDDFIKNHLSGLIEDLSKSRARELFEKEEEPKLNSAEDTPMTGKEKRKARKAKSKRNETETTHTVEYGILPLDTIIKALTNAYPDLSDVDTSSSVLAAICKVAFCTENLEALWQSSVQKELGRLHCAKKASTTKSMSQRDVLGDFQSIEAAFEDHGCFANACYMIQALSKFLSYASEAIEDDDTKDALQKDFLLGCCADFTSRITQYALFKNDVEKTGLAFQPDNTVENGMPLLFYSPIDLAARTYRKTYLSADSNPQTGKRLDPLPMLREVLPVSVGVSIARQWILCGGECYQGGTKPASENNGEAYTRPGDVDGFLAHVQENCLSICGLPFTKLDKKSEKRFLNARRQCLMNALEDATDAEAVLDLTIMLLYQLVKNMVVSGPLLRGPILQMLIKERKVSEATSKELCELAEGLEKGIDFDLAQIERVKGCGLNKQKD